MRQLTHYELRVLIKNEVENMYNHETMHNTNDVYYIQARCEDILKYMEEYFSLEDK